MLNEFWFNSSIHLFGHEVTFLWETWTHLFLSGELVWLRNEDGICRFLLEGKCSIMFLKCNCLIYLINSLPFCQNVFFFYSRCVVVRHLLMDIQECLAKKTKQAAKSIRLQLTYILALSLYGTSNVIIGSPCFHLDHTASDAGQ